VALTTGTRIGAFEIVATLGAGGMGEVYRARDTTLGRDVAIKVIAEAFTRDEERLARFEREARALAALNHPNVGIIYGVENSAGLRALVLELVEGATLAEQLHHGPIAVGDAIRIAVQIARALDAAHQRGIIHRDLKPGNIKVTADGVVKVLDFGLAKMMATTSPDPAASTVTGDNTRVGTVVGTPAYMSPEQARGQPIDTRTDIWAFGCVLYEMLTGKRAFAGATAPDIIATVLEREPPWTTLPRETAPTLALLLKRCLEKDVRQRPPDMASVLTLLEKKADERWQPSWSRAAALVSMIVAVAAVGVGISRWLADDPAPATNAAQWVQLTNFPDAATQPALSADGRMLSFLRGENTFATPGEVYLKHLPVGEATALTRDGLIKMDPTFSPDGNRIAYTVTGAATTMSSGWDTWEVPVVRGEPRRWLRNASGLKWIGVDELLYSEIKRLSHMAIVASTAARTAVRDVYVPANVSSMAHRSAASPDGRWVVVIEMGPGGTFGPCLIVAVDQSSPSRQVGPPSGSCSHAAWSPDGRRMYLSVDTGSGFHLWQQGWPEGAPEQFTAGSATQEEGVAVDPDGRSLITSIGQQRRGIWIHDRTGDRQISLEGYAYWPLFSRNGKTLCFRVSRTVGGGGTASELWMTELNTGRFERLFPGQLVTNYDLSKDDRVVAAVIEADGKSRLWLAWIDGRETPRRLGDIESASARFGRDGEVIYAGREAGIMYLFRVSVNAPVPQKLNAKAAGGVVGTISPNGEWITDFLRDEMRAVSTSAHADVVILKGRVSRLRWSPDGRLALLGIQSSPGPSAFGFGRTYVLPIRSSTLPVTPPGGFASEEDLAAVPGVQVIPYGDLAFSPEPGVYAFSKITVTRNLYRIPIK
jgi:Tol biopolymer transport system component